MCLLRSRCYWRESGSIESGLSILQPSSYKDSVVQSEMAEFSADLCVMAYVTLMVPEEVLNTPTPGSIQYHPSHFANGQRPKLH